MKDRFLNKLERERKIVVIEPSENICDSYSEKSANCLTSARLLLQNNLYENSIAMSYYAMYNSLLALLFRVGIKCENHSASILLLKVLFGEDELSATISAAKKERVDKQYYVTLEKDEITQEIADELLSSAEDFVVRVKTIMERLTYDSIGQMRDRFIQM